MSGKDGEAAPLINDIIAFLQSLTHPEEHGHAIPAEVRTKARVLTERILMAVPSRVAAMAEDGGTPP